MPVRARIVVFYAFIVSLVLAGAGFFLTSRLRSDLAGAVDAGLRARADVILRDVREEFADLGKGEGLIDETEAIAQILGPGGRVVVDSTTALGMQTLLSREESADVVSSASFEKEVRVGATSMSVRLLAVRGDHRTIVVVGASIEENRRALATITRLLWLGGPMVVLLTSAAVWALAGVALRPVERMRAEAEALSFGEERRRLPVPDTKDEIARLGETLNVMLERLEQALERERRFVDDASHELRTPLAVLKTELELALRRTRTRDELETVVRNAAEEVDDLGRLAEHLLLLARADRGLLATQKRRVELASLVDQVRAGFYSRAKDRGVTLGAHAPTPVWIEADQVLLRQAVANLIDNALKHTPSGGKISVEVASRTTSSEVTVVDSGTGFDPDLLPKAFEPFTHGDGRGSGVGIGLGLAIVRAIADAHGGTVTASNERAGGARVVVRIPN